LEAFAKLLRRPGIALAALIAIIVLDANPCGAAFSSATPTISGQAAIPRDGSLKGRPATSESAIRLISLSPNITEIVVALGARDRIVGVSDFCQAHLPGGELPRCGAAVNPNFERILALQPDLLFFLGRMEKLQRFCADRGIRAVSVNVDGYDALRTEVARIGKELGAAKAAATLLGSLDRRLAAVRAAAREKDRPRCLVLLGRETGGLRRMMSVGGASFLSEMLAAAGGDNVFAGQAQPYFTPSREAILAARPEVILELRPGEKLADADRAAVLADWKAETTIPAAARGRIAVLTEDFLVIPGPRMVDVAELLQSTLHGFR
jgi:iron complex transport system substrate-binding protein